MSCSIDDFGPDCQYTEYRKARKEHKCCGCREIIQRGHKYRVESGIWDGHPDRYKYCLRCSALLDAIVSQGESFIHGFECGHSWQDVFYEDPPDEIARLAFVTAEEMQKNG